MSGNDSLPLISPNIVSNGSNSDCIGNTSCDVTENNQASNDDPLVDVLKGLAHFDYFFFPTVLLLGLCGNTLTIVIMSSKKYSRLTSRLLLISLAVSDTILLLTQPFNKKFVIKLLGRDLRALSDTGCKIFFVLFRSGKMTSSWFVAFLCVERFVAVWFPLKAKQVCTKVRTVIAIVVVYAVLLIFNSVWSFSSRIVNAICYPDSYDRSDPAESDKYRNMIYMGCTLYSIGPMIIMSLLTPLIIYKLAVHRQKRKQLTSRPHKTEADGTKTTAMLLGIVFAYIVLVLPVTMLHLTAFFFNVKAFGDNANSFLLFKEIAQLLEQLNYSINFFLYVMTSNQFREGLFELLKIYHCRSRFHGFIRKRRENKNSANHTGINDSNAGINKTSENGGLDKPETNGISSHETPQKADSGDLPPVVEVEKKGEDMNCS